MSLISVNNLTFHYEGSFDEIFEDVSFQIDTDWKLGFTARNGRGKTTFLKLLMGEYEYRGSISCNESFDYFPFEIRDRERSFLESYIRNMSCGKFVKSYLCCRQRRKSCIVPFIH